MKPHALITGDSFSLESLTSQSKWQAGWGNLKIFVQQFFNYSSHSLPNSKGTIL